MMGWDEMSDKLKDMVFPPGTISGFVEKPDDSWELCDGKDGRPDLTLGKPFTHKWYIRNFKKLV